MKGKMDVLHRLWLFVVPVFCLVASAAVPHVARAHEVYVLSQSTIQEALTQPSLQVFSIIYGETGRFFFWMFLTMLVLSFVGIVSVSKHLEQWCDPFLLWLRTYAPFIGRVTLGISLVASGYFSALFGPELPMASFLPQVYVMPFRVFLVVSGALLTIGFLTRTIALLVIGMYAAMILRFSYYMLTYVNYFGEMVIAFMAGGKVLAIDALFPERVPKVFQRLIDFTTRNGFFILRLAFGTSLIYAAIYAKFLHAQLALDTVIQYHLTDYLHFDPPFLVLGALAVELLLGVLFILGIEVRFAALFLTMFLTLSLLYFGEAVWPHIILVGGALTIFAYGYGSFTLERVFLRRRHRDGEEPVL